jgi:hypothetical protein
VCPPSIDATDIAPEVNVPSVETPTRCSFVMQFIIPNLNFGIINSITKLHLVGISTESSPMHGSMNIKFINAKEAIDIHAYK